jgi:uncharacterized membrane protein
MALRPILVKETATCRLTRDEHPANNWRVQTVATQGAIPISIAGARPRLDSIDIVRGLIMVVMALDHVRDFFHHDALLFDPTDLTRTNAAIFFTRWITHFCAPVFFFLAGTGAFLGFSRGKSKAVLARFLVSRGLWLVLLELTVVRCFGWGFNFNYRVTGLLVLWALGWSMVALAALIFLPRWAITLFAVIVIAGHNLLDPIAPERFGRYAWIWHILHVPARLHPFEGVTVGVPYSLIPWVGVMAGGYAFGGLYRLEGPERRRRLYWLGAALTAGFVIIRLINVYGDPSPWSVQRSTLFTVLSFLNCEKYPPSLLYLLMTLGPTVLLLAFLDGKSPPLLRPLSVIGRVPLFYYLLHLPLMHGIAVGFSYLRYGRVVDGLFMGPAGVPTFRHGYPADYGYSLPVVYLVWFAVVVLLYPLCSWFARLKQQRREVWLSYL